MTDWLTERRCPRAAGDTSPCPWIACRWHTWIDVSRGGRRDVDPLELPVMCVLDAVAEHGEHTLAEAGEILGCCRERVRQVEAGALAFLADTSAVDRGDVTELLSDFRAARDEHETGEYEHC